MGVMTTSTGLFHGFVNLHLTVYQGGSGSLVPSVVGGLIGGATVLGGVLFAEYLTRKREQTQRYRDELWNLVQQGTNIFIHNPREKLSHDEIVRRSASFLAQIGRLLGAANPPQVKSKEKRKAVEQILVRFHTARGEWLNKGITPDADEVLGDEIDSLVYYRRWPRKPQKPLGL
jgi:hypothetical protein